MWYRIMHQCRCCRHGQPSHIISLPSEHPHVTSMVSYGKPCMIASTVLWGSSNWHNYSRGQGSIPNQCIPTSCSIFCFVGFTPIHAALDPRDVPTICLVYCQGCYPGSELYWRSIGVLSVSEISQIAFSPDEA
jgi:hypothetical protein